MLNITKKSTSTSFLSIAIKKALAKMTKSKKYAKYLQEQRNKISELVIKFTLFAEMIKRKARKKKRGGGENLLVEK